ncbi:MAG: lipoate--protein ligase [Vigna little leaf phytoplasma]|nr:lipoate--protein ligase [Vigna little leaf phytoplasma]
MILVKYKRKVNDFTPYFYFALEKYIAENLLFDNKDFFFLWQIKGIVFGKNQIIENEINLDFVQKNNINFFRRPTGGGCVYNDLNTPLFSIITPFENKNFSFKKYLIKIIEAFRYLGIELYFSGRNDILYEGKKVSGNSFLKHKNNIIMHGTILYDCDINTMMRCITPSDEKLVSKGINSIRSRVTNLKQYLNGMTQNELVLFLTQYLKTQEYDLSDQEIIQIEKMSHEYATPKWLYFEHPAYTKKLKKRFEWGTIEILLSLKKGKIEQMFLTGDFFHKEDNLEQFTNHFLGIFYNKKSLEHILNQINIGDYILDANNKDFLALLEGGILYKDL